MSHVTRVVLHKHGMAYFEREAKVEGNARLDLGFRHDEMDDVLKSLSFADSGQGQLAAVAYEPHPQLAQRLDDIKVSLPEGGGMVALLGQLLGAEVKLELGTEKLTGRVLGIERVQEARDEVSLEVEHLSLLCGDDLKRLRVPDITAITPADPTLRRDLATLLERLDAGRRSERRRVSLDLRGQGKRDVFVSYVVPSTVWKTSYRVLFDEKGTPRLLGFALVDNDSQDDWSDVRLSLVSGLPISFTHDLYSPRRRARPHVRVETEAPIAPPVLEGATYDLPPQEEAGAEMDDEAEYAKEARPSKKMRSRAAGAGMSAMDMAASVSAPMAAPAPAMRAAPASVKVETRTQELGDMFAYEVATPVSIKAGHSALVPILNESLEGEIVAVYNERVRVGNPLTSFRLKNTSKLTLEGGPATVIREGEYSGEAMVDTMRPDEEKLVPFSVELGCRITTAFDTTSETQQELRITSGYVYWTTWTRRQTTYTIRNTTKRKLTLFIDHPADRNAEYVDSPAPKERTESFDRFVTQVDPGKQLAFKLVQRYRHMQSYSVNPGQLSHFVQLSRNSGRKDVEKALAPLVELATRMSDAERETERIDTQIEEIAAEHERIRENMERLGEQSKRERELRERYVGVLDQDETRIAQLKERKQLLEKQLKELAAQFDKTARAIETK
ncbi:MAG: hypothetical protein IT463_10535 [Planctomycetes bacterium]|nr:hypothetical protein [Planctomycetota bacterium]